MNLLTKIKVGPHRISLHDYLRNVRHSIRIRLYQMRCEHSQMLYQEGGNGDPGYYHCPQCGVTRTK